MLDDSVLGGIYEEPVDTCTIETFHTDVTGSYIVLTTTTSTILQKGDIFNSLNCNFNPIIGNNTSKFQLVQNYAKK